MNQTNKETIAGIEAKVCRYLGIEPKSLHTASRKNELVEARKIIWFFCKELYNFGFSDLGAFYKRDHSTALTGVKKIQELIQVDKSYACYIETIRKELCFQSFSPFVKNMEEYKNLLNILTERVKNGIGISENTMYDGYIIGIMKSNPFSFEILNNKRVSSVFSLASQLNEVIDWLNKNISKI